MDKKWRYKIGIILKSYDLPNSKDGFFYYLANSTDWLFTKMKITTRFPKSMTDCIKKENFRKYSIKERFLCYSWEELYQLIHK